MPEPLADWPRPEYEGPAGKPFLFYVIYGAFGTVPAIDPEQYRSHGVHTGLTLAHYARATHAEVLEGFRERPLWDELLTRDPALAERVRAADECLILQGELEDQPALNYLRDTVGLLAFLLDHGGIAVLDAQMLRWWGAEEWRRSVFEPAAMVPARHVAILNAPESESGEERLSWFHTRGLRKFGRPDVSVRHVEPRHQEAVVDLCDRLIMLQALGGTVPDGQEIRFPYLPSGLVCRHKGDADDPDFHNAYLEIAVGPSD